MPCLVALLLPIQVRQITSFAVHLFLFLTSCLDEYARQSRAMEANMVPLNAPERAVRADISPVEIDQTVDWNQVGMC